MDKSHRIHHVWIFICSIILLLPQTSVHAATTITAVSADAFHTCIIMNGQVWCWGANSGYQLGDGTYFDRLNPVQVRRSDGSFLTGTTHLSTAYDHTCAISQKQVWCWGNNIRGQLSDGTTSLGSMTVIRVKKSPNAGGGWLNNATGTAHSCAIHANQVWCWGDNRSGQLGAGTTPNPNGTYRVKMNGGGWLPNVKSVSAGPSHTCKILHVQRTVYCWGENTYGQVGDGTTITRTRPVQVYLNRGQPLKAKFISAGYAHTCAILQDKTIACWGANQYGQLGDGTRTVYTARPVFVTTATSSGAKKLYARDKIALGADHSCTFASIQSASSLSQTYTWCWGQNNQGQLGTGTTTTASNGAYIVTISATQKLPAVGSLSSTAIHTCAVTLGDGQVWCWGHDHWGISYGTTTKTRATKIRNAKGTFLTGMKHVAVGFAHSCALSKGNEVLCWDDNSSGQLGSNRTTSSFSRPVNVKLSNGTNLTNVYAIDDGLDHTCALFLVKTESKVACWGSNGLFQVGVPTGEFVRGATPIPRLPTIIGSISAGGNHTCIITQVLTTNSRMLCWGNNMSGQIGKGNYVSSHTPAVVTFPTGATLY
jgi:alpha-tubulin suppressor-like RCC1 family protein